MASFYLLVSSLIYTLGDLRFVSAYQFFVARGGDVGTLTGAYLIVRVASLALLGVSFALMAPVLAGPLHLTLPAGPLPFDLFLLLPLLQTPSFVYSYLRAARGEAGFGQWPLVLENAIRTPALIVASLMFSFNTAAPSASPVGLQLSDLWSSLPVGSQVDLLGLRFTVQTMGPGFITAVALAYVVGATVPFFAILLHSALSPRGLYRHLTFHGAFPEIRAMFTFAAPLIGAMFLSYAVSSLPPFFVATFPPDGLEGAFQAFTNANAFLLLLMFLPNAITLPLFPDMASLFVRGENREFRRRARKSLRFTVMILAPAVVSMIVFRKVLLILLYNASITIGPLDAEWALAILAASVIPQALFRITGSVLDAVGQQKRELYLSAVQLAVLSTSLCLVLIPASPLSYVKLGYQGLAGAAFAVLLSMTAGFLSNAVYMHRYVKIHPDFRPYILILLAAAATFALFSARVVSTFGSLFGDPTLAIPFSSFHYAVLVVTVVAGTVLYVLVLAAIGELTKEDVLELGGSLGLPKVLPRGIARLCWRTSWPDPPGDEDPFPFEVARFQRPKA